MSLEDSGCCSEEVCFPAMRTTLGLFLLVCLVGPQFSFRFLSTQLAGFLGQQQLGETPGSFSQKLFPWAHPWATKSFLCKPDCSFHGASRQLSVLASPCGWRGSLAARAFWPLEGDGSAVAAPSCGVQLGECFQYWKLRFWSPAFQVAFTEPKVIFWSAPWFVKNKWN